MHRELTVSRVWSSNWPAFHQEILAGGRAPDDWQATSYSLAALSGWFSPRRRTSKGCTATQTGQNVGDDKITWQAGCTSLSSRRSCPAVYHHYCYLSPNTSLNDRTYMFRTSRRRISYNQGSFLLLYRCADEFWDSARQLVSYSFCPYYQQSHTHYYHSEYENFIN
jgi:hypothetical protein